MKEHNIPVTCTFLGKGAKSDRTEQLLLAIGLGFKGFVSEAVEKADLILPVGYYIAEFVPEKWNPTGNKKIVHSDFVPAEVYTRYDPEIEVIGDISGTLWELNQRFKDEKLEFDGTWYRPIRQIILDGIESYKLKENGILKFPAC